jgi:hypothetical protein
LPNIVPLHQEVSLPSLAESYYIVIPRPSPSLGRRSPGRPRSRLDFPPDIAPWLKPLLERFEGQRKQVVGNAQNRYLIFNSLSRTPRNTPVSTPYIEMIVRRVTEKVLGATCNAKTLRKTAAVMFARRANGAGLRFMGWKHRQAFAYNWHDRKIVHPKTQEDVGITEQEEGPEFPPFPQPQDD